MNPLSLLLAPLTAYIAAHPDLVANALAALVAHMVRDLLISHVPVRWKDSPWFGWAIRVLALTATATHRSLGGTFKLPFVPDPVLNTPRPPSGQAGFARTSLLVAALMLSLGTPIALNCHPTPPPVTIDGGVSQPSSWTDSVRTALDAADWIVPAVRVAVQLLPVDATAKAAVVHAIDVVTATALPRLHRALDAYVSHGGDRCEVLAATAALDEALLGVTDSIAQLGWGPAREVGQLVDALAALVDTLAPACGDAGWTSAGSTANARLLGAHRSRALVLVRP